MERNYDTMYYADRRVRCKKTLQCSPVRLSVCPINRQQQRRLAGSMLRSCAAANVVAGQLNANMQHNRANGDTSTKIGVMTP